MQASDKRSVAFNRAHPWSSPNFEARQVNVPRSFGNYKDRTILCRLALKGGPIGDYTARAIPADDLPSITTDDRFDIIFEIRGIEARPDLPQDALAQRCRNAVRGRLCR